MTHDIQYRVSQSRCEQGFISLEATCSSLPGGLLIGPLTIRQLFFFFQKQGCSGEGNQGVAFHWASCFSFAGWESSGDLFHSSVDTVNTTQLYTSVIKMVNLHYGFYHNF